MKKIAFSLIVGALFLGNSTRLPAQILFNNGSAFLAPDNYGSGGYGYYADTGNTGNPTYVFSEAGDVFTPSSSGIANYVDFAGLYYGGATPGTDTFVLSLYSISSGAPNELIGTSLLPSFSRMFLGSGESQPVYEFSGLLQTPFTLTEGTSYYFGISDTTDSYEKFAVVVSATVPPGGSSAEYSLVGGTSTFDATGPDALSFDLQSVDTPEPSEGELLVLGFVGLILVRRCARLSPRA